MYVKITSLLALLALANATDEANNYTRNLRNNRGPCPNGSEKVVINFDRLANGAKTAAGEAVSDQWEPSYGVTFKGTRGNRRELNNQGQRNKPVLRLFDSSNPQHKNRNFGSPNERCEGCGNNNNNNKDCPGVANHSYKDIAAHTNCENQNRVLIIDSGRKIPDPVAKSKSRLILLQPSFCPSPRWACCPKTQTNSVVHPVRHTRSSPVQGRRSHHAVFKALVTTVGAWSALTSRTMTILVNSFLISMEILL